MEGGASRPAAAVTGSSNRSDPGWAPPIRDSSLVPARKRAGRGLLRIAQGLACRQPSRPSGARPTSPHRHPSRRQPLAHRRGARRALGCSSSPAPWCSAVSIAATAPGGRRSRHAAIASAAAHRVRCLAQGLDRPSAARGAKRSRGLTAFRAGRYRLDSGQIGRISDSPDIRAIAEEDRNARLLDVTLQGS